MTTTREQVLATQNLGIIVNRAADGRVLTEQEGAALRAGFAQLHRKLAAARAVADDWRTNRGLLGRTLANQLDDALNDQSQ